MPELAGSDYQTYEVPVKDITVSEENVRDSDREKGLDELASSIREKGLLQPVVLLGSSEDPPPYELIVGQRRLLAHQLLGEETIVARFAGPLDPTQAKIRSLVENMQRVEINHADAMKAVTELYREYKRDERRVSQETGLSLRKVRQYIYIEDRASEATKEKLRRKEVQPADVQRVLRAAAGNVRKADALLESMKKYKLSSPQKQRMVEYGESNPRAAADTILKHALRPRREESILVRLPERVREALDNAARDLAMAAEELALRAVADWLSAKGYFRE